MVPRRGMSLNPVSEFALPTSRQSKRMRIASFPCSDGLVAMWRVVITKRYPDRPYQGLGPTRRSDRRNSRLHRYRTQAAEAQRPLPARPPRRGARARHRLSPTPVTRQAHRSTMNTRQARSPAADPSQGTAQTTPQARVSILSARGSELRRRPGPGFGRAGRRFGASGCRWASAMRTPYPGFAGRVPSAAKCSSARESSPAATFAVDRRLGRRLSLYADCGSAGLGAVVTAPVLAALGSSASTPSFGLTDPSACGACALLANAATRRGSDANRQPDPL